MYKLPVRLGRNANRKVVILGSEPTYGDAGWGLVACSCREDALRVMAENPQARMPCWRRIEAGEC